MNLVIDGRVNRLRNLLTYVMEIEDANPYMVDAIRRKSRWYTRCTCRQELNGSTNCNDACPVPVEVNVEGEFTLRQ